MFQTNVMHRCRRISGRLGLLGALIVLAGCNRSKPAVAAAKPPEVSFVHPVIEDVRDYEEYTGRTAASKMDEIRARVTGELTKIFFADGTEVKKGDPLFEIDPRPFEAALERHHGHCASGRRRPEAQENPL